VKPSDASIVPVVVLVNWETETSRGEKMAWTGAPVASFFCSTNTPSFEITIGVMTWKSMPRGPAQA
jgi:hypothetical protein